MWFEIGLQQNSSDCEMKTHNKYVQKLLMDRKEYDLTCKNAELKHRNKTKIFKQEQKLKN